MEAAEAEYRKELEAHRASVEALIGLAVVAAARGDLDEAARRAEAIARGVPTVEGYVAGVTSLLSFGRRDKARTLLAEARRAFPGDPRLGRLAAPDAGAGPRIAP